MTGEKIKRCLSFGVKFDETDELCKNCEDAVECLKTMQIDEYNIEVGVKPKVLQPKQDTPPIMLQFTESTPDNIGFKIFFNKEWLRKRLEREKK